MAADGPDCPRRGRVAARLRWSALSRCDQFLVGQPLRAREPAHRRRSGRATLAARARDAGGIHARARRGARRAAHRAGACRADPLLLRRQRLERDRSRAQDELPLLAQLRPVPQAALRHAHQQLPRRDARRTRGRPRRTVSRDLPAVADGRDRRADPGLLREGAWRKRRGLQPPHVPGDGAGARPARRRGLRGHRRAAGAVRRQHAHVRPRVSRAAARRLRPAWRAPDRGRDRGRVRPHGHDVRLRAGRHRAGLPLPVEGAHRRLPAAFRGAHRRAGLRRLLRRVLAAARLPALAQLHRQPARLRCGARDAQDLRGRRRDRPTTGRWHDTWGSAARRSASSGTSPRSVNAA